MKKINLKWIFTLLRPATPPTEWKTNCCTSHDYLGMQPSDDSVTTEHPCMESKGDIEYAWFTAFAMNPLR